MIEEKDQRSFFHEDLPSELQLEVLRALEPADALALSLVDKSRSLSFNTLFDSWLKDRTGREQRRDAWPPSCHVLERQLGESASGIIAALRASGEKSRR